MRIALAILVLLLSSLIAFPGRSATIRVPANAPTIADGLALAHAGDSVLVAPGLYYESGLVIPSLPSPGIVLTSEAGAALTIIDGTGGGFGSEILAVLSGAPTTEVSGFTFQHSYYGIRTRFGSPRIVGNSFVDLRATAIDLDRSAAYVQENAIIGCGVGISVERIPATVSRNTLVLGTAEAIELDLPAGSPPITLTANLIVGNLVGVHNADPFYTPGVICNDVWGNSWVDFYGMSNPVGENGNISANPLLCDLEGGNLQLDGSSPCLPGHHPDGVDCGIIGAFDFGCGSPTNVEPMTWGRLRLRARAIPQ